MAEEYVKHLGPKPEAWLTAEQFFHMQLVHQMCVMNTTLAELISTQKSILSQQTKQVNLFKRWLGAPNPGPLNLVVEKELMAGTDSIVPSGFEVHHDDKYVQNNSFSNLFALHKIDHGKWHARDPGFTDSDIPF